MREKIIQKHNKLIYSENFTIGKAKVSIIQYETVSNFIPLQTFNFINSMTPDHSHKLFLLDAMALVYRSYFAFASNPRVTSKGVNTNAEFGFTNTLLELFQKEEPTHIAIVFDTHAPTVRHEMDANYKAQRPDTPEDIIKAVPNIIR